MNPLRVPAAIARRLRQLPLALPALALVVQGCLRSPDATRVACVGDSITHGIGIPGRRWASYPAVLEKLLGRDFHVRNFGVPGATMSRAGELPWWDQPEFQAATDFAPQIVIIVLGTNDSKPQNWIHGTNFSHDYEAMIDHFAALPSRPRILLALPPPAFSNAHGIDESVLAIQRTQLRVIADRRGLSLVDLHTPLSHRLEWFPDTIHPNAEGAAAIANAVASAVVSKQ